MPMYRFRLIDQGRVIATQDQECTDDQAAVEEQYDGLDINASNSRWVELGKVDIETGSVTPVHAG